MARPSRIFGLGPELRASDAARRLARARLLDLRRQAEAVARDPAVDAIHDLRVALRRLRAAVDLFGAPAALDAELKALAEPLGRCRDAQLRLEWLARARAAVPAAREACDELAARERASLKDDQREAGVAVRRWIAGRPAVLAKLLEALSPRGSFGGHRLRRRLDGLARKADGRVERLGQRPTARQAHKLRLAIKRLRYAAELLEPTRPKELGGLLRGVTALQTVLGELHDADVRIAWLKGLRGSSGVRPLLARARLERLRETGALDGLVRRWRERA